MMEKSKPCESMGRKARRLPRRGTASPRHARSAAQDRNLPTVWTRVTLLARSAADEETVCGVFYARRF